MQRYILKRLLQAVIVLFAVSVIIFLLAHLAGDPINLIARHGATAENVQRLRAMWGLDKPLHVQYWIFISSAVQGNFGESTRFGMSAFEVWFLYLPNTLILAGAAFILILIISIPTGVLAAVRVGGWFDRFGKVFALMGQSLPEFWVGTMLILFLAVNLGWLPTSGMGSWRQLLMPAFTNAWYFTASLTRLTRSSMLDVLDSEYIKMARIKGVPETLVILKHAFRNSLIPIVSLLGLVIISLPMTSVITEVVFRWPGIGRLMVQAALSRDFPVVQCCAMIASVGFVFSNLFVDILYAYIDPRIRYQ